MNCLRCIGVSTFLILVVALLAGCSMTPSITPIDAELNLSDKYESNHIAATQDINNTRIQASEVTQETNHFGLSTLQLLLFVFLAGLGMPSFHEVLRLIQKRNQDKLRE